jgi:RimJ/RimL family protein N-acetyltransferase
MIKLSTKRLIIRNFTSEDFLSLQELIIDKEKSQYAKYDHEFPTEEGKMVEILKYFCSTDCFLAVQRKNNNDVIGYISIDGDYKRNLGFCFNSQYHGNGFAIESCRAVIDYLFNTLKVEILVSGTAQENIPSARLLEKLGFCKKEECEESFRSNSSGEPIKFIGNKYELLNEKK